MRLSCLSWQWARNQPAALSVSPPELVTPPGGVRGRSCRTEWEMSVVLAAKMGKESRRLSPQIPSPHMTTFQLREAQENRMKVPDVLCWEKLHDTNSGFLVLPWPKTSCIQSCVNIHVLDFACICLLVESLVFSSSTWRMQAAFPFADNIKQRGRKAETNVRTAVTAVKWVAKAIFYFFLLVLLLQNYIRHTE